MYNVPELQVIIDGIKGARDKYLEECKENNVTANPERLKLLDIMEMIADVLETLKSTGGDDLELRHFGLSVFLLFVEQINAEYRLLNPEFKQGYVYNSGSKLRKVLLDILFNDFKISPDNKLNPQENIIFISKFYHQFTALKYLFDAKLNAKKYNYDLVEQQIKNTLMSAANHIITTFSNLLTAIPVGTEISQVMKNMPSDYLAKIDEYNKTCTTRLTTKASNEDRELIAEIAAAISELKPAANPEENRENFLSESDRVKIGFLLVVINDISKSTYYYSIVRDLCLKALNITKIEDYPPALRLHCISAYKSWASNHDLRTMIEDKVNDDRVSRKKVKCYISGQMENLDKIAASMIDELQKSLSPHETSIFSLNAFELTSVLGAAFVSFSLFSGVSATAEFLALKTNVFVAPKLALDEYIANPLIKMLFGNKTARLSYFVSDMFVNGILKGAITLAFNGMALLSGGGTGLMAAKAIEYIYGYLKNSEPKQPILAQSADPRLIECAVNMPFYTDEEKTKIQRITGNKAVLFHHEEKRKEQSLSANDERKFERK